MKKKSFPLTLPNGKSTDEKYYNQIVSFGQSARIPRDSAEVISNRYGEDFDEFISRHEISAGIDPTGEQEFWQHTIYQALFNEYQESRQ